MRAKVEPAYWDDIQREALAKLKADLPNSMQLVLRVQDRDRKKIIPLRLNECQRKLHELIEKIEAFNRRRTRDARAQDPNAEPFEKIEVVIGKCRRGGVSTYVQARGYLKAQWSENFRVMTMAHKGKNSEEIFRYSSDFHRRWPKEHGQWQQPTGQSSKEGVEFANASRISTETSGGRGASRGTEYDFYHLSEVAWYDSYAEVDAAIAAAPPHSEVYEESTANGAAGGFYERWKTAMFLDDVIAAYDAKDFETLDKWSGYVRFFFSWLDDPAYREFVFDMEREPLLQSLDDYERALMNDFGASLEQIKWRRSKIKRLAQGENKSGLDDEQYFMQEYPTTPTEMFQTSGLQVFDARTLDAMEQRAKVKLKASPPTYFKVHHWHLPEACRKHEANLTIYEPPQPGAMYAVGGDVGYGVGKDRSVAVILDRTDGTVAREVACFVSNRIGAEDFGEVLTMLAEWYNGAFLTPEVNGPGVATCIRVAVENRYPWIYHRQTQDLIRDRVVETNSFRFGYHTLGQSKNALVERMRMGLKEGSIQLFSDILFQELRAYRKKDEGGYTAPDGEYDDACIAVCLAYFGHSSPWAAPPVTTQAMRNRQAANDEVPTQDREWWASVLKEKAPVNFVQKLRNLAFGR